MKGTDLDTHIPDKPLLKISHGLGVFMGEPACMFD